MPGIYKLTAKKCDNAKPETKPYRLSDGQGLFLEVAINGSRYWRYRYKFKNKENQLGFGTYPEVTLQEARERHKETRKLIRSGIDPSAKRKEQKQLRLDTTATTFKEFAMEWYGRRKIGWSERHAQNILSRLSNDVFPAFGDIGIDKVLPAHVIKVVESINDRGSYDIAKRTLQYCVQVFNYAVGKNIIQFNPAQNRHSILVKKLGGHFATISSDEIPAFLEKLYHYETPIKPQTRLATMLLMLTFVRTKELTESQWSEINFETARWIIPAKRMKKRRDHIVPLARQTIEILHLLKEIAGNSPYVLPSRSRLHKPMSDCTILNGL